MVVRKTRRQLQEVVSGTPETFQTAMKFNDANEVDQVCYEMRLSDYPRGLNRARINELLNGWPPYSEQEVQENNIEINVNWLEGTRIAHDGRSQLYSAFLKPGNYFKCNTDSGPVHKRDKWNSTFTKYINRPMKRSIDYFETFRSRFALDIAHGIGPAIWPDDVAWCPDAVGIEDVLIPANTLLTMKNLPFFAVYRSFTGPELIKLTKGHKVDPAWNMPMVDACIKWVDEESAKLMGNNWPEVWAPEKASERVKGDGGFYAGDQVPTIDTFDFYFFEGEGKDPGWRRRMILDAWSAPTGGATGVKMSRKTTAPYSDSKGQFLYDSKTRKFANKREELISFQFADLSAVAPFRYHSVRSLGFLLYAVCHIQNRMRCKFNEAVFESLMMYFRVKSMEDVQRGLKLNLINKAFIDETFQFIPAAERHQVNAGLVELGLKENSNIIDQNSSSWTQNTNQARGGVEKTKFQVMAETNAVTSLISAGLLQAYQYQAFEYREIVRRFCRKNSTNHDVSVFRAACLKDGIPEKYLVAEAWEAEPERTMGAGNKTMEMAIAEWLMNNREKFDPEPQRDILRRSTLAVTDDPALSDRLVPETPQVSNSIHDAQLSIGALMAGGPVFLKSGVNRQETIAALLNSMGAIVQRINASGGVPTPQELIGLKAVGQHIGQNLQELAKDKTVNQLVKKFNDDLSNLMNQVRAFEQRLQEQMQKAAQKNGNGGMDPKDQAKIMATQATADAKIKTGQESHAQRTAQRQLQFEQQMKQDAEKHRLEMQKEAASAAQDIHINRLRSLGEE